MANNVLCRNSLASTTLATNHSALVLAHLEEVVVARVGHSIHMRRLFAGEDVNILLGHLHETKETQRKKSQDKKKKKRGMETMRVKSEVVRKSNKTARVRYTEVYALQNTHACMLSAACSCSGTHLGGVQRQLLERVDCNQDVADVRLFERANQEKGMLQKQLASQPSVSKRTTTQSRVEMTNRHTHTHTRARANKG